MGAASSRARWFQVTALATLGCVEAGTASPPNTASPPGDGALPRDAGSTGDVATEVMRIPPELCEFPGTRDCDGIRWNGCEVYITWSREHCGACGNVCPLGQDCVAGVCGCRAPYSTWCAGRCVSLESDETHCGACGNVCTGGQLCSGGACWCAIAGTRWCGDHCVEIERDHEHCGACGRACPAAQECYLGACVCPDGGRLCGEECVRTIGNPRHCGACGVTCAAPEACFAAACACPTGDTVCNGRCVDTLTDTSHCGVCGRVCPADTACVGATCVASGVRLVAPISTARVTSRRPTLRWRPLAGSDGTRVDLCQDRALTAGCVPLLATGDSARPASALAPGTWFWRARAVRGGVPAPAGSPVWQFLVRGDAPVDTTQGFAGDLNGDGLADVVRFHRSVETPGAMPADVGAAIHLGRRAGVTLAPDRWITGCGAGAFHAGDLNGDGFGDLVVSGGDNAVMCVFFGRPSGVRATPDLRIDARPDDRHWLGSAGALGDVNRDGFADLVYNRALFEGTLITEESRVYLGGATGPVGPAGRALRGAAGGGFDVNGDGYPEVTDGLTLVESRTPRTLLPGGPDGVGAVPLRMLTPGVGVFGDFDGDGRADLGSCAVPGAGFPTGRCAVFAGAGGDVPLRSADFLLSGLNPNSDRHGIFFSGGADVDGDGRDDLLAGTWSDVSRTRHGAFAVAALTSSRGDPAAVRGLGSLPCASVGASSAGDANGDGFDEVLLGVGNCWDPTDIYVEGALVYGGPEGAERPPSLTFRSSR